MLFSPSLKPPSPFPSSRPSYPKSPYFTSPNPTWIQLHPKRLTISLKCLQISDSKSINRNPNFSLSCLSVSEPPVRAPTVAEKLRCLVSEFRSLQEPIDRVKRLLEYATLLPPFDESGRVLSNRVMGCTAQVWLEVKMDADGAMRFSVDSDSEITKGFCSCLIWLLDGAAPEEVLEVKKEDLVEINVGLPANSRVNTWHNILISMQERTKDLVSERYSGTFPCLITACDDVNGRGSYTQAQIFFSQQVPSCNGKNWMLPDHCPVLGVDLMSEHVHLILDLAYLERKADEFVHYLFLAKQVGENNKMQTGACILKAQVPEGCMNFSGTSDHSCMHR